MNNQAQQILQQCIRDYGMTLGREPQRLEALLKDYAKGQHKREIFVIVQAAKEHVVEQLLNNSAPLELLTGTLAHQLTDNYGIDRPLADWAIESWLFALNLSQPANTVELTLAAKPDPDSVEPFYPVEPPTGSVTLIDGRYLDNGDGTVTDQQTGLQWMRCSLGQTCGDQGCQDDAKTYSWHQATKVAGGFSFFGFKIAEHFSFAGYDDWRLPTLEELKSLIEKNKKPSLNHKAFPNTPTNFFWSSSPSADYSNFAWRVNFTNGYVYCGYKPARYHVRLVRGGR